MSTLVVTPLDLDAPGSYRLFKRFRRLQRDHNAALQSKDSEAVDRTLEALESMIESHLSTDDGSPAIDLIDQLSYTQFWDLFDAIIPSAKGVVADEAVPLASDSGSSSG